MDWNTAIFDLIDMRSFSSLWYWIALAAAWSSAAHWVVGVPYDMVTRARRYGGAAQRDLELLARIHVDRVLSLASASGLVLVALSSMVLSFLLLLGFWYGLELAQAVVLIMLPMSLVGALSLATARGIRAAEASGENLRHRLRRQRVITQIIGLVSIFFTAMWGMYQNLLLGPLGG